MRLETSCIQSGPLASITGPGYQLAIAKTLSNTPKSIIEMSDVTERDIGPGYPISSPVSQDLYNIHIYKLIKKRKIHTEEKTYRRALKRGPLESFLLFSSIYYKGLRAKNPENSLVLNERTPFHIHN